MITVAVKLFATLRQRAGWSDRQIRLEPETTVGQLLDQLSADHPGLDLARRTIYAAVNEEFAQRSQVLQDGDDVAIFPPVSGGEGGTP